jgi:hypothetical protein
MPLGRSGAVQQPASGGFGLGVARGAIQIDVSGVSAARQVVEKESRAMGSAFDTLQKQMQRTTGSNKAAFGLDPQVPRNYARGLQEAGTAMVGLSIAGGSMAVVGLRISGQINAIKNRFEGLAGSQKQASVLMEQITKRANDLGVPARAAQAAFAGLVPSIKGGREELDRYIGLTARLATLNQNEGTAGAAFSIREALSSGGTDLVSLSERFNLPRKALRDLIKETGDFGTALDIILNRFGATEEAARKQGKSLEATASRAREAFENALAAGIQPFRDGLTGILQVVTDVFNTLQKDAPILLTVATGFAGIVATAGAAALAIGNVVNAVTTLNRVSGGKLGSLAGAAGGALKTAAPIGIAAGLGVGAGLLGAKALSAAGIGDQDLKDMDAGQLLGRLVQRLKEILAIIVTALTELGKAFAVGVLVIKKAFDNLGEILRLAGLKFVSVIGELVTNIGNAIFELGKSTGSQAISEAGGRLAGSGLGIQGQAIAGAGGVEVDKAIENLLLNKILPTQAEINDINKKFDDGLKAFIGLLFPETLPPDSTLSGRADDLGRPKAAAFSEDQIKIFADMRERQIEIDEKAAADILDIEEKLGDDRTKLAEDKKKALDKVDKDSNDRIADAAKKRDKDIAKIQAEAPAREAAIEQEAQDRVDEIRSNAATRQKQELQDHLDDMAERERRHRLSLIEAASNLDAKSIFEQQSRFNAETKTLEAGFAKKQERQQEQIDREVAQVNEAARAKMEAERANDQARIDELMVAFEEQKQLELEQKEERRQAIIDEFNERQAELEQQAKERIQQIQNQAILEKNAVERKAAEQIAILGQTEGRKLDIIRKSNAETLAEMNAWASKWNAKVRDALRSSLDGSSLSSSSRTSVVQPVIPSASRSSTMTMAAPKPASSFDRSFASGTANTGMGGWTDPGEGVLNATTAQIARDILGANYTQPMMQNYLARGGGRGPTEINLTIPISGVSDPHMAAELMAAKARQVLHEELEAFN